MFVFKALAEVRAITEEWIDQYNEERPHDALGDLTPFEYRVAHQQRETLQFRLTLNKGMFTFLYNLVHIDWNYLCR